jgi:hypothetical protein
MTLSHSNCNFRVLCIFIALLISFEIVMIMSAQFIRRSLSRPFAVGVLSNAFLLKSYSNSTYCASHEITDDPSNPLCKHDGLPLFQEIKAEHVIPAVKNDLHKMKSHFEGNFLVFLYAESYLAFSLERVGKETCTS